MRLRKANAPSADDLALLEEYRTAHLPAYDAVVAAITSELEVEPGGRPGKLTESVIAKLRREKTRLPTMQDIVGCRLVVEELTEQDAVVAKLCQLFPGSHVDDKREKPKHGYRAVHVIVERDGYPVEIQVRTRWQQAWANLSEGLAEAGGAGLKYGADVVVEGLGSLRDRLLAMSTVIAGLEQRLRQTRDFVERAEHLAEQRRGLGLRWGEEEQAVLTEVQDAEERIKRTRSEVESMVDEVIADLRRRASGL